MTNSVYASVVVVACVGAGVVARAAPGQSAPPSPVNVCSLLTVQEASAALGETVKDGKAGDTGGRSVMPNTAVSYCEFASPTSVHRVHINVWRTSTAAQVQQMGQMVCGRKTKDGLDGLGDIACWYDTKHEELQVYKGPFFLSVEMSRRWNDPTEAIKGVAKAALPRLP